MNEDDRDIVEFTDEEGNSILLEVLDTFFYNGEEFAVLADAIDEDEEAALCGECGQSDESGEGCACGCCGCGTAEGEEDEGEDVYLMKIVPSTSEDGEEMEEFVPVEDDDLMEKLIEIVQTRFVEDDEDDE